MTLSCIISEIKRDISRKLRFFHTPAFDAPVRESPSKYCNNVWYGSLEWWGLRDSEKKFEDRLTVLTQYRPMTDGRTDGLLRQHSPRYA